MSAEADALCGADYGERVNSRNGYRPRQFDSLNSAIPKLRTGSYFPDWLLEGRRRAERAMIAVIAEAYVLGLSTRPSWWLSPAEPAELNPRVTPYAGGGHSVCLSGRSRR
jgi:mutator family transposase